MPRVADLATGRSGDKGDVANVAIVATSASNYALLQRDLTVARVKAALGDLVTGAIERYELENVGALNFVLDGALDGGATRSLRFDTLGKSLADRVLRIEL
jgi:hypothetical protein